MIASKSAEAQMRGHAEHLGGIIGNLLTIELLSRMALQSWNSRAMPSHPINWGNLTKGALVPLNCFTNGDDLRQVLERFNKQADRSHRVDVDWIVSLRDALAHGRVLSDNPTPPLKLFKFSRKKTSDNKVVVEYVATMSEEWFKATKSELIKVIERILPETQMELREIPSA